MGFDVHVMELAMGISPTACGGIDICGIVLLQHFVLHLNCKLHWHHTQQEMLLWRDIYMFYAYSTIAFLQ